MPARIPPKAVNALSTAALQKTGLDLFEAGKPGLTPALLKAMESMAAGGTKADATKAALSAFAQSPAGKAAGAQALKALGPILDEVVKRPELAKHWGQLVTFAAKPGAFKPVTQALTKVLGKEAGTVLGTFTRQVVRATTRKGFGEGIKVATKAAPRVLGILGKLGKLVPGLGLAASLVSAVKVFANPNSTPAQKAAALLDVTAGVVGVIPGAGTAVQVGLGAASTAATFAADAAATKKPVELKPQGAFVPTPQGGGNLWG